MNNEDKIRAVLAQILYRGLLRIRNIPASATLEDCRAEADHLHNLPGMIHKYSFEGTLYYYKSFRRYHFQTAILKTDFYEPLWKELGELLEQEAKKRRRFAPIKKLWRMMVPVLSRNDVQVILIITILMCLARIVVFWWSLLAG